LRTCPQCHLLLEQIEWETVALWVCRSCGGCWFPAATLDEALTNRRSKLAQLDTLWPGISAAGMFEGLRLSCPECPLRTLEPEPLSAAGNQNILRCRNCRGAWLLAGERTKLSAPETNAPVVPVAVSPPNPPAPTPKLMTEAALPTPPAGPITVTALPVTEPATPESELPLSESDSALARLLEGNRRYVDGSPQHPAQTYSRRAEIADGQNPFAIIVGCSDSRVPPEIVFDQGLGDLFVVRTAGATYDTLLSEGVAYAAERFGVPLILVVGHEGCSAVRAAVDNTSAHPYLTLLVKQIRPAAERARTLPGNLYENAVKENVHRVVEAFAWDRHLQPMVVGGNLRIMGAYYDLHSGRIEILEDKLTIGKDVQGTDAKTPEEETTREFSIPFAPPAPQEITLTTSTTAMNYGRGPIPVEQLPPVIAQPEQEPSYSPPEPQIGASAPVYRMTEQGSPTVTLVSRWCPQCRRGFTDAAAMCNECGVGLVMGQFCIRCLHCQKENRISADHCWSCLAPLHTTRDGRAVNDHSAFSGRQNPPSPYINSKPGAKPSQSCTTSVFMTSSLIVVGILAGWLLIGVLK
jgi:carbonic anhydrase